MQPQVWSVSADFLWYEKCIKIQIMSNWTTIQFAQFPVSIFVDKMLQHVSTCWKQGWTNIGKLHKITCHQTDSQTSELWECHCCLRCTLLLRRCWRLLLSKDECAWVHKIKVVHNDTIYVYIILYNYISNIHQNTTSYNIKQHHWKYSREKPSCFHKTASQVQQFHFSKHVYSIP
jgi:hypothetical protein